LGGSFETAIHQISGRTMAFAQPFLQTNPNGIEFLLVVALYHLIDFKRFILQCDYLASPKPHDLP
jgi:hypothetical protein